MKKEKSRIIVTVDSKIKKGKKYTDIYDVPMSLKELKRILKILGNKWHILLIKAVEEEHKRTMGELAESKPPWYTTDYFFREDVIADNLRLAVKYKFKNI